MGDRVRVSRGKGGLEAGGARGRGVRSHAAFAFLDDPGCRGGRARLRRRRQLVEAGERLVLALAVELLPARDEAVGSEDPQLAKVSFERAAAGAVRAGVRPPYEERVGSQGEDVVDADARGEVVREVEQRADTPQHRFDSV